MFLCAEFDPWHEAGGAEVRVWATGSGNAWKPDWKETSFRTVQGFRDAVAQAEETAVRDGDIIAVTLCGLMLGVEADRWPGFVAMLHEMVETIDLKRSSYTAEATGVRLVN